MLSSKREKNFSLREVKKFNHQIDNNPDIHKLIIQMLEKILWDFSLLNEVTVCHQTCICLILKLKQFKDYIWCSFLLIFWMFLFMVTSRYLCTDITATAIKISTIKITDTTVTAFLFFLFFIFSPTCFFIKNTICVTSAIYCLYSIYYIVFFVLSTAAAFKNDKWN